MFQLDPVSEFHDVLVLQRDVAVQVVEHVLAVTEGEEIKVAVGAAQERIVAGTTVKHVDIGGTGDRIVGRLRVAHGVGDVELIPDHPVGEDDLGHASIGVEVAPQEAGDAAEELLRDGHLVAGGIDRQDQVDPLAPGRDLGRGGVREAQDVGTAVGPRRLAVVEHGLAEVAAEHVGVAALPAHRGLVVAGKIEDVGADRAGQCGAVGGVVEDIVPGYPQHFRRIDQGGGEPGALVGRNQVGEDEALGHLAGVVTPVVGVDHIDDRLPLRQVVERALGIARSRRKDRLEQGDQLAAGGRAEEVCLGIVGHVLEEAGKLTLRRKAHRHGLAPKDIAVDQRAEEVALLGQVLAVDQQAAAVDGRDQGGQVPEVRTAGLGGEGREPALDHLDPVGAGTEVDQVLVGEGLQIGIGRARRRADAGGDRRVHGQRGSPVAARRIVDVDGIVMDRIAVVEDREAVGQRRRLGRGKGLHLPDLSRPGALRQHVGEGRLGDHRAIAGQHVRTARQGPVGTLPEAVVEHRAIGVEQIGRGWPVAEHRVSIRRPGLLQPPGLAGPGTLRQHVGQGRTGDHDSAAVQHVGAARQAPVTATAVFLVDAVVASLGTVDVAEDQDRRQFARRRVSLGPGGQQRIGRGDQSRQVGPGADQSRHGLRQRLGDRQIVRGRQPQPGQDAVALDVDEIGRPVGHGRIAHEPGQVLAGIELGLVDVAGRPVIAGEAGLRRQVVVGRGRDIDRGGCQADRDDAGIGQARELARIADPVPVQILPDLQQGEVRIGRIDDTVAVGVQNSQFREAGDVRCPEQLGDIVDRAVAVPIQDQEAIVRPQPTGLLGEEVTVQVEVNLASSERGELQAVAIEIQHQRILRRQNAHPLEDVAQHISKRRCLERLLGEQPAELPLDPRHRNSKGRVGDIGPAFIIGDEHVIAIEADHEFTG